MTVLSALAVSRGNDANRRPRPRSARELGRPRPAITETTKMSGEAASFGELADTSAVSLINPVGKSGSDGSDNHLGLKKHLRPGETQYPPACRYERVLADEVLADLAPLGVVIVTIRLDE